MTNYKIVRAHYMVGFIMLYLWAYFEPKYIKKIHKV